jgi:hypothetical protein
VEVCTRIDRKWEVFSLASFQRSEGGGGDDDDDDDDDEEEEEEEVGYGTM